MNTVLFLCTGNYYRSRFAECFFNAVAEKNDLPWRASSRGLAVGQDANIGPISQFALGGLEIRGIHLNRRFRFPLQATDADLEKASLIIAIKEAEHRPMLAETFPKWADRVEYWHVDDLESAGPGEALPLLEKEVRALVARLKWGTPHARRAMLVLSRKKNESIIINDNIVVLVVQIQDDKVRLGIKAPKEVTVHRREVYEAIKRAEEDQRKDQRKDQRRRTRGKRWPARRSYRPAVLAKLRRPLSTNHEETPPGNAGRRRNQ